MSQARAVGYAQLARFRLLRELGRGAQARVWLAHDPRLDREVALKLLDPAADAVDLSQWLHEARAVARLTHPHIVPVFEADEHEGQPYLVFEYVPGPTLSQARRGRGPMPAREAATLVLGVLDALAAAHDLGIVHRDLKPSNILLASDGRARVMDFGIAARVDSAGGGDGCIVGTPGYMSPEAARGEAPLPAMDVFAAGVLLGELLAGAPLLRETDPYRAVHRVQHEDLALPAHLTVDATLSGIVQRALARDRALRYDTARTMHTALAAWLAPAEPAVDASGSHATLEFLLRRMRHKTDFPALSRSVVRIQRVASSETESLRSLADEILKDVALTNKLLRMVNSVHFTAAAGGGISTVSRAVALVGFAGIRNMALSLVLLEHMPDKAQATLLRGEYLRALMAGTLAEELTPRTREGEEAFLGAMFQNLGRLLAEYYFAEEALQVRQQLGSGAVTPAQREAVSRRVLGIGYDELGAGVAKAWGLPETLQSMLRAPLGEVPTRRAEPAERQRWLGRGANEIAAAMLAADAPGEALAACAASYAPVLGLTPAQLSAAAAVACGRLTHLAEAMGLPLARAAPQRSRDAGAGAGAGSTGAPASAARARGAVSRSALHTQLEAALALARGGEHAVALRVNEVLHLVLDTMQRTLALRCVVLCLREPASGRLLGRVGLGPAGSETSAIFCVEADTGTDLFAALCARGADLIVADTATVSSRLPPWYRQRVRAGTFIVLPLLHRGSAIGLIYADKAQPGTITLDDGELALLRALRDHAAMAFGRGG